MLLRYLVFKHCSHFLSRLHRAQCYPFMDGVLHVAVDLCSWRGCQSASTNATANTTHSILGRRVNPTPRPLGWASGVTNQDGFGEGCSGERCLVGGDAWARGRLGEGCRLRLLVNERWVLGEGCLRSSGTMTLQCLGC